MAPPVPCRIAVIGAGYWGPNLVRNFTASPTGTSPAIVDLDRARAAKLVAAHGDVAVCGSVEELLDTVDVDAVAIATPARTHHAIALAALRGRQARAGGEAAGRQPAEGAGDGRRGAESAAWS